MCMFLPTCMCVNVCDNGTGVCVCVCVCVCAWVHACVCVVFQGSSNISAFILTTLWSTKPRAGCLLELPNIAETKGGILCTLSNPLTQ